MVVNEHGIVLGRLRLEGVDEASEDRAEDVIELGTVTVRADADVERITPRLWSRGVGEIIVSTPDGELLGVLHAGPP